VVVDVAHADRSTQGLLELLIHRGRFAAVLRRCSGVQDVPVITGGKDLKGRRFSPVVILVQNCGATLVEVVN
jgi:hypothetical protein